MLSSFGIQVSVCSSMKFNTLNAMGGKSDQQLAEDLPSTDFCWQVKNNNVLTKIGREIRLRIRRDIKISIAYFCNLVTWVLKLLNTIIIAYHQARWWITSTHFI